MAGYWIIRGTVKDEEAFAEYVRLWQPIAKKYGATFIASGKQHQTREGTDYARAVIVQFDSYEQAVACYDDPDYQALAQHRHRSARTNLAIVEGVA